MDGDLQNDPIDIPRMVGRLLREDLDLVAGWRKNQNEIAAFYFTNLGDSYAASGMGAGSGKQLTNRGTAAGGHMDKPRKAPEGLKPKDLVGAPWRVAFALQEAGWIVCGKFSPTLEQRFFDVGKWLSNNGVYYASAYGYSPNYTCAEFRCYLGESDHGRGRIHHSQ